MSLKVKPIPLKIKPEVAKKWVKALRSGKYKQGTERLHARIEGLKDEFCCLGVLCDIAVQEGVIPAPTVDSGESFPTLTVYEYGKRSKTSGVLPPAVVKWAGMDNSNPNIAKVIESEYPEAPYPVEFSSLNDEYDYSFKKIATLIEKAANK